MAKIVKNSKFDKKQSNEIDSCIKKIEKDLKSIESDVFSFEFSPKIFLIREWNELLLCCKNIDKYKGGILYTDSENKTGILTFVEKIKEANGGTFNAQNIVNSSKLDISFILQFLRKVDQFKMKEPKITKMIACCEKILNVYAKSRRINSTFERRGQEIGENLVKCKGRELKSNDIIRTINYNLCWASSNLDTCRLCLENGSPPSNYYKKYLETAFSYLCELAESESKTSSQSRKGLAGWYNKHKKDGNNIENIFEAILDIDDKYIKGTGFLGFKKSRLSRIVNNIDTLREAKTKYDNAIKKYEINKE